MIERPLNNGNRHHDDYRVYSENDNKDYAYNYNGFVSSWFTETGEIIKYLTDFFSYWSQLNFSLAIAIERYVLIVKATQAQGLLTKSRRQKFYALTIIWVSVPALIYLLLQNNNLADESDQVEKKSEIHKL